MSDHIYKHIELTGSSDVGTDQAIKNAIEKAGKTVKHMDWFEVVATRGYIDDGAILYVNGEEVSPRLRMPDGAVTGTTFAPRNFIRVTLRA